MWLDGVSRAMAHVTACAITLSTPGHSPELIDSSIVRSPARFWLHASFSFTCRQQLILSLSFSDETKIKAVPIRLKLKPAADCDDCQTSLQSFEIYPHHNCVKSGILFVATSQQDI